jgi:hypothetical protein
MQVVFMRQSQIWNDDPDLRETIIRFEPIRSRDAALEFLAGGPSDPLPTLVGLIGEDAELEQWHRTDAKEGFEELWECAGSSGLKQWRHAKEIKRAYEAHQESNALRECLASPSPVRKRKPGL